MKYKYLLLLGTILLLITGCFKKDSLENVTIYTTNYPIQYITERVYGDNGEILSIYPNDVNINTYKLTDKQLSDYSKGKIFIYNGLSKETDYAIKMLNKNKNLLIIDAATNMEYINDEAEIWLNPSNFLMMAQNIKNGFKEYITSNYLKKEIDENYEKLKIDVSQIDAELNLTAQNASDKNIVVTNDLLMFLEKYNLNVLSLVENDNLTAKKLDDIDKLMASGKVKYIFNIDNEELNKTTKGLVEKYNITVINFKTGSNLSETEHDEKIDFLKIMNDNVEFLKQELYQ